MTLSKEGRSNFSLFIAIYLVFQANLSFGHPGGPRKSGIFKGCHQVKKTGEFHCHSKSVYNGKSWPSEIAALAEVSKSGTASENKSQQAFGSPKQELVYNPQYFSLVDEDGDCQDTRAEILIQKSETKISFKKGSRGPSCLINSGKWKDFYTGESFTEASKIQIDHIVPKKHAWDLGAKNWPKKRIREFANDPLNLVITSATLNREKRDKSIADWLPRKRPYACRYVKRWIEVKVKYGLDIPKSEKNTERQLECNQVQTPSE